MLFARSLERRARRAGSLKGGPAERPRIDEPRCVDKGACRENS